MSNFNYCAENDSKFTNFKIYYADYTHKTGLNHKNKATFTNKTFRGRGMKRTLFFMLKINFEKPQKRPKAGLRLSTSFDQNNMVSSQKG